MAKIQCPTCSQSYQVPDTTRPGTKLKCKKCSPVYFTDTEIPPDPPSSGGYVFDAEDVPPPTWTTPVQPPTPQLPVPRVASGKSIAIHVVYVIIVLWMSWIG